MDILNCCPHASAGLDWMSGRASVPTLGANLTVGCCCRYLSRGGRLGTKRSQNVQNTSGKGYSWACLEADITFRPWAHLLNRGDADWMNCPSQVPGKSDSDPTYVGTAQGSSAIDYLLSTSFCCKEFMCVGGKKSETWNKADTGFDHRDAGNFTGEYFAARTAWIVFHARLDVSRCREADQGILNTLHGREKSSLRE